MARSTYIGTLLALELGDGVVGGGRSETTDLIAQRSRLVSLLRYCYGRVLSYLRHGGHEAGGDADEAQALACSREVSSGKHRGSNPVNRPLNRRWEGYYGGEVVKGEKG